MTRAAPRRRGAARSLNCHAAPTTESARTMLEPSNTALILAAETSTRHCSVAVCSGTAGDAASMRVLAECSIDRHRLHSEKLISTVDWILGESGVSLPDLDCLAVSIGPGSFTGLRIGAAAFKGLAYACSLPLLGVPTLDALARLPMAAEGCVVPLLDARMGEVFGSVCLMRGGVREKLCADMAAPVGEVMARVPEDAGTVLVLGDGADRYAGEIRGLCPRAQVCPGGLSSPRATGVAAEALHLLGCAPATDPALVNPVYLRASQAEISRGMGTE